MRTFLTGLLLALALVASGTLREARACDLQAASGSMSGVVMVGPRSGQDVGCVPIPFGPIAAAPMSNGMEGDPEGSNPGPERVDLDAYVMIAIGLDGPSPRMHPHRMVSASMPETRAADRSQQPPRY